MDLSNKIFVSSGCSFSECISPHIQTWPRHTSNYIQPKQHISKGMGSQGNGLISRSIIYEVDRLLNEGVKNTDIIVGVMWSGYSRSEYYWDTKSRGGEWEPLHNDGWMYNPTNFNKVDTCGNWIITNYAWKSCKEYYKYYYDHVGGQINTLEHVLRTQWFLEKNKIDYFMMQYKNETFDLYNAIPCLHLYNQVDWKRFVLRQGCHEWCKQKNENYIDNETQHPTTEAHKDFTESLIIPFIESNYG